MPEDKQGNMKRLWAPWRITYILTADKSEGCFLCEKPRERKDEENLILLRGEHNFLILNSFPYNPGHLLIAPYRHIGDVGQLTLEEATEHFLFLQRVLKAMKQAFNPDGFNIGLNLGRAAGAGVEDHIHTHVVPRWNGDTNFMPVLADVKVIPEALADTYKKLKRALGELQE
ncbi:MAG: Purine nucleoside phosphoramidase/Ap4A hydrolase [Candidatus Alkanophagales archaeon MCA70_species_2]|nr:Purine nucleoside phosphoramidase/Ap4A hydrolase [Candidatus Alkanophaga liquidiphilum]